MADLLSQYIEIALNPGQIANIMSKDSVTCGQMNVNDLNGAFQLASHIIVQRKQNQLNKD
jgi:S-ribosylhomocysteine lyase LuxS involved in autoinducer biosynthesis